jgi:hypothetical protein
MINRICCSIHCFVLATPDGFPKTGQRVQRKLTAILSADAKGYGRLMSEDEVATVDTLKAY